MIRNPLVIINGRVQELPLGDSLNTEEVAVFSKRIDFITDNELYKGEAPPGSLASTSTWRISKVIISVDGDVSETWAEGSANFNKSWLDRLTYSYV